MKDILKYIKTIIALANTQGGKLIVGIDDKTLSVIGVKGEELFQIMDNIASQCSFRFLCSTNYSRYRAFNN